MALYLIGLGLCDEKDITLRGLYLARHSDIIYLEEYTSLLSVPVENLKREIGKKIILADRDMIEKGSKEIISSAIAKNVSVLIIGDPLSATTHIDLINEAEKAGVKTEVVNNASIINAVGITGLQLYKFGKTTSIPYFTEAYRPESPYDALKENLSINAHTLMLLDLNPADKKFMTANEAIKYLLSVEEKRKEGIFTKNTFVIGCARMGSRSPTIKAGAASEIAEEDFGKPLHCIIVPGQMHFVEEENIERWRVKK
jgi:diphthine synthase